MTRLTQFKRLLNWDFTIHRKNRMPDGAGGFKYTFAVHGTVRGRMSTKSSPTEREIGGKYVGMATHEFFTEPGADILRGDLIEGQGKKFRVIFIAEPSEGNLTWQIDCEEVDPVTHNIG